MTGETAGWVKTIHETTLRRARRRRDRRPARDGSDRGRASSRSTPRRRSRPSRTGWRRIRRSSEGIKEAGSSRSDRADPPPTAPHDVGARCLGYPGAMKIYTRRNAAVGYLTLKAMQRAIDKKRRPRRSGLRVATYVGLGLVSAGILAGRPGHRAPAPAGRRHGGSGLRDRERDRRRVRHRAGASSRHVNARARGRRRVADPARARGARSLRAGQAGRGGAARARPRACRQARLERGPVRALPGGAGGDRARDPRAESVPGRRRLAPPQRPRRAARRPLRAA